MARIAQLTLPGLAVPRDRKELYQLAVWAGNLTGVRPALILGLIEVESALGTNVGQCNCAGQPVCRHPELTYKQVMPPSHWTAFEQICKELGLNPNTTPVSCYVGGGKIQWGGAMGPAQFMPNTWLNLGYKQRIENLTGIKPANPWRASDAFLAAALYLADFNASTKNLEHERGAVTAYLCGTTTMTSRCRAAGGEWYRNLVLKKLKNGRNGLKVEFNLREIFLKRQNNWFQVSIHNFFNVIKILFDSMISYSILRKIISSYFFCSFCPPYLLFSFFG